MRYHKVVTKGIAFYDKALEIQPEDYELWNKRGWLLWKS